MKFDKLMSGTREWLERLKRDEGGEGLDIATDNLQFLFNGQWISAQDTPYLIGMENDQLIHVFESSEDRAGRVNCTRA